LRECGVPDCREIKIVEEKRTTRKKTKKTKTIKVYAGKKYDGVSSGNETWHYDCGPDELIQSLTFTDSRLVSIKTGGRGTNRGLPCPMSSDWTRRKELSQ
jgi:hypothetical protein